MKWKPTKRKEQRNRQLMEHTTETQNKENTNEGSEINREQEREKEKDNHTTGMKTKGTG